MKFLSKILLLALLAVNTFAQKGFNVVVSNPDPDIKLRIAQESQPYTVSWDLTNQTFGGTTTVKALTGGYKVAPGWNFIVRSWRLDATRDVVVYLNIGSDNPNGYLPYRPAGIRSVSGSGELTAINEGASINTLIKRYDAADGDTPVNIVGAVTGDLVYKGYDVKADYNLLLFGDSNYDNSAITTGDTDDSLFQGMVRSYFEIASTASAAGKTARIINKAKGSTTSANLMNLLRNQRTRLTEPVHFIFGSQGTNDVVAAFSANGGTLNQTQIDDVKAKYLANIKAFVQQHIRLNGNKIPLLFLAPIPHQTAAIEAVMLECRNVAKTYFQSINAGIWNGGSTAITKPANNIYFYSPGATTGNAGLWPAATGSYYIETGGNGIHMTPATSKLFGAAIVNFLTVNNIKLK